MNPQGFMKKNPWLEYVPEAKAMDLDDLAELADCFSDSDPLEINDEDFENEEPLPEFSNIVVVDNVPRVGKEKIDLLKKMLTARFGRFGDFNSDFFKGIEHEGLFVPFDESLGQTAGFAFIHYLTPQAASQAVAEMDGMILDPKHTFKVNLYSDLLSVENWPEEYVIPSPEMGQLSPAAEKKIRDKNDWLLDDSHRDQFAVRHGNLTEVYWSEGFAMGGEVTLAYGGEPHIEAGKTWTEMGVTWSPRGSFFMTFHAQGVLIWAGSNFEQVARFGHFGVTNAMFSEDEKRLLTYNGSSSLKDRNNARALILWDVETGKEIRAFENVNPVWPQMSFSADGQFLARILPTGNGIALYHAESGRLAEKKPIKTKGIIAFKWSSSLNSTLLAYWAPDEGDQPATVVILDAQTREMVKRKNLFNAKDIKLHWQSNGDFLCAEVTRQKKRSKTTFTVLEVFRLRDADIPNETMELTTDAIHFSWEPNGFRFAVISKVSDTSIQFFSCEAIQKGSKIQEIGSIAKEYNQISWSPAGNYLVLHNLDKGLPGFLFYDLDQRKELGEGEHYTACGITWETSGRIVATIATQSLDPALNTSRNTLENGYFLWSFQGEMLKKTSLSKFYQFHWRPRPNELAGQPLLTDEEKSNVMKDLRYYVDKYAKEDLLKKKRLELAANVEKLRVLKAFRELMLAKKATEEAYVQNARLLGHKVALDEKDYEVAEVIEEVLLSEKSELYDGN